MAGRELGTVLALVSPTLRGSSAALWRARNAREIYRGYLVAMHGVVRASVPLMNLALERCRQDCGRDRVTSVLAARLPEHLQAEQDHDAWLARDMAAAGLDVQYELAKQPSAEVAALVGAQYYWIEHHHPACLLGYIAALELNAPHPELAGLLAARTGLPSAAFSTIRLHSQLDPGHGAAILDLLDAMQPDQGLSCAIRVSALHTIRSLISAFDAIRANRTHEEQP